MAQLLCCDAMHLNEIAFNCFVSLFAKITSRFNARKIEVIRLGACRAPVVDEKRTAFQSHSDDDVICLALT